jgi:hypothetical protein
MLVFELRWRSPNLEIFFCFVCCTVLSAWWNDDANVGSWLNVFVAGFFMVTSYTSRLCMIHDQLNCRWHHSHCDFSILNTQWTLEASSKLLWRFGMFFLELKQCVDENDILIELTHLDSDEESTTTRNDALRERERESLGIYPSPCFSKVAC